MGEMKKKGNIPTCGECANAIEERAEWNMSLPNKDGIRHPVAIRCKLDNICYIPKELACKNFKNK